MTPRDIITKNVHSLKGVRFPDANRAIDKIFKDLAEHGYVVIEHADVLKSISSKTDL